MLSLTELASQLKLLKFEMERREPPVGVSVDRSIPGLVLYLNPSKVTNYPSSNPNRVEVIGDGDLVDEASVSCAIERFRAQGISKFFFWVDPLSGHESLKTLLSACGLKPFGGTTYHVLARTPAQVAAPPTDLTIRRLTPDIPHEILGCYGDENTQKGFRDSVGQEGFDHFAAFAGENVVATARAFTHGGISYFCDAGTQEGYRCRGGQTALIAARINRAAELKSSLCVVQTLAMLTTSLDNLLRAGFQHSFDRSVYEYELPKR